MVKLEEVLDESFRDQQAGPQDDEDWDTDSDDSALSDTSSILDGDDDETLLDRLSALKDMIPPTTRRNVSSTWEWASGVARSGLGLGAKTLWVVSTSVLLVGVPWALALSEDQQMEAMEREIKAQEKAGEMLTMGVGGEQGKPAL